jgi:hypothetical protein
MRHRTVHHAAGFFAALLLGAIAGSLGCSSETARRSPAAILSPTGSQDVNRQAVDARRSAVSQEGATAPSGLAAVSFGGSSLTVWPYTGESLDGSPADPVNLFFVGNVDPVKIRAALLSLDGNRPPFPPAYPFNARWSDAIGNVQTNYSEGEGWQGSVIQLQLGVYGPVRVHLRLWRTGAPFGSSGTWTVGAVHFDLTIPGTADHQVLAWEVPQQVVLVDMLRSGLLDATTPLGTTAVINQVPNFRTIPPPIYNGLPDALKVGLGLPPGPSPVPVPIPNDGRASILHVTGEAAPQTGHFSDAFSYTYNQIIPKPFCSDGPLDWVRVAGPVTLRRTTDVNEAGHYQYHSHIAGRLTVTPVDVTQNPPIPAGLGFEANVRELQQGSIDPLRSWVMAESKRILPQDGGSELFMSRLRVGSRGQDSYGASSHCLAALP